MVWFIMLFAFSPCETSDILKILLFIDKLVDVAFVIIPIGLIVMLSLDIAKNVIASKEEDMSKNLSIFIKRIISCVALFLVPVMVDFVVGFVDDAVGGIASEYQSCKENMKNISYYEELEKAKEEKEKEKQSSDSINTYYNALNSQLSIIKFNYNPSNSDNSGGASNGINVGTGSMLGKGYKLTNLELKKIAAMCQREQGNVEGVKAEASLMANRYELYGSGHIYNYLTSSKWWASDTRSATEASADSIAAVKTVLVLGSRTLPLYVDEHDCIYCGESGYDIIKLVVGDKTITAKGQLRNPDNYDRDKTVIYNRYGAVYTFYTFPTPKSDPFGYTKASYNKIKGNK